MTGDRTRVQLHRRDSVKLLCDEKTKTLVEFYSSSGNIQHQRSAWGAIHTWKHSKGICALNSHVGSHMGQPFPWRPTSFWFPLFSTGYLSTACLYFPPTVLSFCCISILCLQSQVKNKSQHKCLKSKQADGPLAARWPQCPLLHTSRTRSWIQIPQSKRGSCVYEKLYMLASVCVCVCAVSRVGRLCWQKVHLVL